jgi:hypothetical protein
MPPYSVGFAQVEHRLGIVRRRLNLFMLQDVFYWSGCLATLAAALLVAVALRGRSGLFAVAVWAAVGAIAAAVVAAILRARRRWRSREDVVRWADSEAGLQDRLATLLLDPVRTRASRLSDMLLEQVLAAAPRWDVAALAPRRVPRSLYALVAALAVLIATSFFARPPAIPLSSSTANAPLPDPHPETDAMAKSMRHRAHSDVVAGAPQPGASAQHRRATGGATDEPMQTAGAGSSGEPGESSARAARQDEGHPSSAVAEHRGNNPGVNQELTSPDEAPARTNPAAQGMTEQLQDAIRHALAASRPEDSSPRRGSGRPADEKLAPSDREAREPLARHDTGTNADQRNDGTLQPSGSAGQQPGTGASASAGAQSGDATAQLFSQAAAMRMIGEDSQRLAIKLGAFAALAPNQVEPQQRRPPPGTVPLDALPGKRPATLSEEQVPDAPLQKADVAPQHETVVRRIFTRE